ncbi:MAG: peptidoglycan-associated lipoprotein Pal [Gammaproteobacteria bacterium]|nr:peptidoglycan-associated lipoprotein Pal [Gammaproteobacteria bacterium]
MKAKRLAWLALAAAVVLVAGCSSTGTKDGEGAAVEDRGASAGGGVTTSGAGAGATWTGSALEDPNSLLYTKVIYFDFDQDTIRGEYIDVLRAHATYLVTNPGSGLTIEGHADERGSREYNIGLGERRANAVKRFLEAEGVSPSQVGTLSYGEERPAVYGNDELSWAENRRAVLVYY